MYYLMYQMDSEGDF
jgi:leukotriene-A4 hydrolase